MAFRGVKHLGEKIDKLFARPLTFLVDLTFRCNQDCRMCYLADKPDSLEGELTTEEWIKFIDDVKTAFGPAFMVFSGGEPLIRADTVDILKASADAGMITTLSTNGTLIDGEKADMIMRLKIKDIMLSLEGTTAGTHDKIAMNPGSFQSVTRAIRLLQAARKKHGAKTKIGIITCIISPNLGEMDGMVKFAEELGVDWIQFRPMSGEGRGGVRITGEMIGEYEETVQRLRRMKPAHRIISNEDMNLRQIIDWYGSPVKKAADKKAGGCRKAYEVILISPYGDVSTCVAARIGNLRSNSMRGIFRSNKEKLAQKMDECDKTCAIGTTAQTRIPYTIKKNAELMLRSRLGWGG
jgi:MoaA/NifB/PqqE/SkfB family radical SAM enzyme